MRFFGWSLIVHAGVAGTMIFGLGKGGAQVAGTAGLAGNTRTHFDVTMDQPRVLPPPIKTNRVKTDVRDIREGIETPHAAELPTDVKHETPREIETRSTESAGTTTAANLGVEGQAGMGNQRADLIGNGDRSNRLGLYLQKMNRKIRANLAAPGFLSYDTRTMLVLEVNRDGRVTKIILTESSGDATLDRKAIQAVEKSSPFDPWDRDQRIQVPVVFNAR